MQLDWRLTVIGAKKRFLTANCIFNKPGHGEKQDYFNITKCHWQKQNQYQIEWQGKKSLVNRWRLWSYRHVISSCEPIFMYEPSQLGCFDFPKFALIFAPGVLNT